MVKYYGRAKTRVGAVNTNQLGLKMSGCPSKIGKQGALVKYQSRRVQCNQKFCGPVYYQGQMWSWNSERCVPRAPRTQAFNSGVGHINAPRFGCGSTCSVDESSLENAIKIINEYFSPHFMLVFMGNKELFKYNLDLYNHLKTNLIDLADKSKVKKYPSHIRQAMQTVSILSNNGIVNGKKVKFTPVLIDLIAYHYLLINNNADVIPISKDNLKTLIIKYGMNNQNNYHWGHDKVPLKDAETQLPYFEIGTLYSLVFFYFLFYGLEFYQPPISKGSSTSTYNLIEHIWVKFLVPIYKDIAQWDTSNITNMKKLFSQHDQYNGNLTVDNIHVSKIQNYYIRNLFGNNPASDIDENINNWNTSNVKDMSFMFSNAAVFNQPIGNWDTSNVTDMSFMFFNAAAFNQPIGNWDTSKVKTMSYMFSNADIFNQPINTNGNNWNVSNVTDMSFMFSDAFAFNQPIGNWDTSNVTDMSFMFFNASAFNENISNWNVNSVVYFVNFSLYSMLVPANLPKLFNP